MTAQLFNVTYMKAASPYQVNETAAWPLDQAVRLIAAGIAGVADGEPGRKALEEAVAAHRAPKPQEWQKFLLQPSWFKFHS